jgi:hypothetical protein
MHGIYCKTRTCKRRWWLIKYCILYSCIILVAHDSFCCRVCAIRFAAFTQGASLMRFDVWASPSCIFIFECRLHAISFVGVAFMRFHIWASPSCVFKFEHRLDAISCLSVTFMWFLCYQWYVLFVICDHQGEKRHPRLRPSGRHGQCLRHPDGLVCFVDARVLCVLSTSFLSIAFT